MDQYDRANGSDNPSRSRNLAIGSTTGRPGGVPLHLEPGLRAILEPIPGGRMRLHWILVDGDEVHALGTFEGTKVEVMAHLKRGPDGLAPATDATE